MGIVVVAEASLDANAVPALIIMAVMILYAGVGLLWHMRRELSPLMVTIGYAGQAGALAGLGAGVATAVGFQLLLVALGSPGLDLGEFPVVIVEIGAAFGLGVGAFTFLRRQRQGFQPDQPIPWRRLIAPVLAFAVILLLVIIFFIINADASLIGLSLIGGAVSGWGLGAPAPEIVSDQPVVPVAQPASGAAVARMAGVTLLLAGVIVGLLPLWAPLVGIPVK